MIKLQIEGPYVPTIEDKVKISFLPIRTETGTAIILEGANYRVVLEPEKQDVVELMEQLLIIMRRTLNVS